MTLVLAKCDKCGLVADEVREVGYDGEHKCKSCHIDDELCYAERNYAAKRKWVHEVYGKQLREMRAEIAELKEAKAKESGGS